MKTISTTVQIAALAICFAAQFHPAGVTGMPGTRKAMQTLEVFTSTVKTSVNMVELNDRYAAAE